MVAQALELIDSELTRGAITSRPGSKHMCPLWSNISLEWRKCGNQNLSQMNATRTILVRDLTERVWPLNDHSLSPTTCQTLHQIPPGTQEKRPSGPYPSRAQANKRGKEHLAFRKQTAQCLDTGSAANQILYLSSS